MKKLVAIACVMMSLWSAKAATEEVAALVTTCSPTKELYFQNRNLADVVDLAVTGYQKFGSFNDTREYRWSAGPLTNAGQYNKSGLYLLQNDGAVLTFEFHGYIKYATDLYHDIGNGFELKLTQEGDDIYGQVTWYAGTTGVDDIYDQSWEHKKKSNFADYNSTTVNYSTSGSNLKLTFVLPEDFPRTVTFLGKDGETLSEVIVPAGVFGPEAPVPTEYEGYVFFAWDKDFSQISEDTTVTALYHKLFTVVFKDVDGTVLSTQIVEETTDAVAPDMAGYTYQGSPFSAWDTDFTNVSSDLEVTASYEVVPEEVVAAIESGDLPENALIWAEGTAGTWDGTSYQWYNVRSVKGPWAAGAVAVFPVSATVDVDGTLVVGELLPVGDCQTVTFVGGNVEFVAPAKISSTAAAVFRFENTVVGENGLNIASETSEALSVEIAGDLALTGVVTVSNAVLRTVGEGTLGGGVFKQELALKDDGQVSLESSAEQAMSGIITATSKNSYVITQPGSHVLFNENVRHNWHLRIAGHTAADQYSALPSENTSSTYVLPGGVLEMRDFGEPWGPQVWDNGGVRVMTNGVMRLTHRRSLGIIMHTHVEGGLVTNEVNVSGTTMPPLVFRFYLNDGARFVGTGVCVGQKGYYNSPSFLDVGGSIPSSFEAESIIVGYETKPKAANNQWIGLEFRVKDVTGDDGTDLTVTSRIVDREGKVLCEEGIENRMRVGLFKTGAGTVELLGAENACTQGVFSVTQGTVRIGETCSGEFGAFVLKGDSSLDCAGGSMSFEDSSEMEWSEGATLLVSGDVGTRSVRFGTDATGLTRAQLDQIRGEDEAAVAKLNSRGYLMLARPETLILVR